MNGMEKNNYLSSLKIKEYSYICEFEEIFSIEDFPLHILQF